MIIIGIMILADSQKYFGLLFAQFQTMVLKTALYAIRFIHDLF